MNKNFIILKLADAIEQSKGDEGRNQYLLERLRQNREITNSDKNYLERILDLKISNIQEEAIKKNKKIQKKDKSIFLNPNMIKCNSCKTDIKLDEKSSRFQNNWYHEFCTKPILDKNKPRVTENIKISKNKLDLIQVGLTVTIVVFLVTSVFFILGPISMIAMGIGGIITLYHVVGATGKLYSKTYQVNEHHLCF